MQLTATQRRIIQRILRQADPQRIAVLAHHADESAVGEWAETLSAHAPVIIARSWRKCKVEGIRVERRHSDEETDDFLFDFAPTFVIDLRYQPTASARMRRHWHHLQSGGLWITSSATIGSVPWTAPIYKNQNVAVYHQDDEYLAILGESQPASRLHARLCQTYFQDMILEPAGVFDTQARVFAYASAVEQRLPSTRIEYPELHLRRFRGSIELQPNLLAIAEQVILPSSFKHPFIRNLWNERIVRVGQNYGIRTNVEHTQPTTLAGEYYDLGSAVPGHFGHTMTESLAKVWGWKFAKAENPDLRALHFIPRASYDPQVEVALFGAAGIDSSDLVFLDSTSVVESFISPTLMWQNAAWHYVHPGMPPLWKRMREALHDQDSNGPTRVFISRRSSNGNRACRNTVDVEEFFTRRGFAIVYPEDSDTKTQANMVADAEIVAGFGGSAMFNMVFSRGLKAVLILTHEAYNARNEQLYASAMGADTHYLWSAPDKPQPAEGWTLESFQSSWAFDFERNAGVVDGILRSLEDRGVGV